MTHRVPGFFRHAEAALLVAGVLACHPSSVGIEEVAMTTELEADLEAVREARIFFNHQSVGGNILDGLRSLSQRAPEGTLRIVTVDEAPPGNEPAFVHAMGGENRRPESKLEAFASLLRSGQGPAAEIAMMKFCYIDINPGTDVMALLDDYSTTIGALRAEFPETTFVHVSVPLGAHGKGTKDRLYRLIGRDVWSDGSNAKRNEYNELLAERFPDEPIFDLAMLESTWPDGRRETFNHEGRRTFAMVPAYTNDGGHLNAVGRERAAASLVRLMARVLRQRASAAAL